MKADNQKPVVIYISAAGDLLPERETLARMIAALPVTLTWHVVQTPLGEGGGLVSGGEGQRVRLGRALLRADVRLVILDEPFRGLDVMTRELLQEYYQRLFEETGLTTVFIT